MRRVFSGVQPTGDLHLGNYLGAIRNFVDLQEEYECLYCVVDLHAITVWQDPVKLAANTREVAASFLASGIDPKNSIMFNQSQVPAHAELSWILSCVSRIGWLNRMTQFKDKAGKNRENASVGLYVYPNLMAADILAYKASHVPVGEDQKQHLELTRDIATKFNNDFSVEFFPVVEPLILGEATRVMSLRDGKAKMSKSDPSDNSRINLTDGTDEIVQKIRKARTDPDVLPGPEVLIEGDLKTEDQNKRPEAFNLLSIYSALSRQSLEETLKQFQGMQFSSFKDELADLSIAKLAPIGEEMQRLMADPGYVDNILQEGAIRANNIAQPILKEVHQIIGFLGK
ncbi:MAG: tryptophan--tRNA ligase [Alphaproteobacteria bacterium]|jgi:tryptophanyl-tRNA synthetase|nr:tryptophan--tRNA ligase [Alphaproteobacteria bacterium]PPR14124.1 MAG: Tryptophan--tRNA ligase [Alphaproteobacteria bacterium MarineAlpha12_Bin1]|tara:strand:+ start:5609 stop:6634 length:1026 start_codon:yes stop_codon:yes gene_type:complete